MTARSIKARSWRRLALALALVAAPAVPAGAQFFAGHAAFKARPGPERIQLREFFPFPFWRDFNPGGPPPRPPDYSRAPPPRKVETPPTETVLVIGDSFADWLGYGLEMAFADTPEIGVVRRVRTNSGLVRYDARNEALEWPQVVKDVLANEKPNAIVVMLGLNDRLPLRERIGAPAQHPPEQSPQPADQTSPASAQGRTPGNDEAPPAPSGADQMQESAAAVAAGEARQRRGQVGIYEFRTDKWAELYSKRIDEMIAALKSKGVPVFWVGLPAIRGTRSTSDMSYLDELYRARAEKAGITYVDIWDGFVDERGNFAAQGPDFEGQIRRLRTGDGVHFTKAGALKLALYVDHELRRVMTNRVPVALPGPEQPPKGAAPGARPAIGAVVPLNGTAGGETDGLLGDGSRPAPPTSDPIATRVLIRGETLVAPAGRADDFSWPRADAGSNGAADTAPPLASASASPPKGSAAGKAETKRPAGVKTTETKPSDAKSGR